MNKIRRKIERKKIRPAARGYEKPQNRRLTNTKNHVVMKVQKKTPLQRLSTFALPPSPSRLWWTSASYGGRA